MSDGREERQERDMRIDERKRADLADQIHDEDAEAWEPEREES